MDNISGKANYTEMTDEFQKRKKKETPNETQATTTSYNKKEFTKVLKELTSNFYKVLEDSEKLYNIRYLKEINDFKVTIGSVERDLKKIHELNEKSGE
jgi:predicted acetyltransferase